MALHLNVFSCFKPDLARDRTNYLDFANKVQALIDLNFVHRELVSFPETHLTNQKSAAEGNCLEISPCKFQGN